MMGGTFRNLLASSEDAEKIANHLWLVGGSVENGAPAVLQNAAVQPQSFHMKWRGSNHLVFTAFRCDAPLTDELGPPQQDSQTGGPSALRPHEDPENRGHCMPNYCAVLQHDGDRACQEEDCARSVISLEESVKAEQQKLAQLAAASQLADADLLAMPQKNKSEHEFVKLQESTETILHMIKRIKDSMKKHGTPSEGALMAADMRSGVETLINETDDGKLGSEIREYASANKDMVEAIRQGFTKERLATLTREDLPSLLHKPSIAMTHQLEGAIALRKKLASVSELADLLIGRAGVTARARLGVGAGAVVPPAEEQKEARRELDKLHMDPSGVNAGPIELVPHNSTKELLQSDDLSDHLLHRGPGVANPDVAAAIMTLADTKPGASSRHWLRNVRRQKSHLRSFI